MLRIPCGIARNCVFCGGTNLAIEHTVSRKDQPIFRVWCRDCVAKGPIMHGNSWEEGILEALHEACALVDYWDDALMLRVNPCSNVRRRTPRGKKVTDKIKALIVKVYGRRQN